MSTWLRLAFIILLVVRSPFCFGIGSDATLNHSLPLALNQSSSVIGSSSLVRLFVILRSLFVILSCVFVILSRLSVILSSFHHPQSSVCHPQLSVRHPQSPVHQRLISLTRRGRSVRHRVASVTSWTLGALTSRETGAPQHVSRLPATSRDA